LPVLGTSSWGRTSQIVDIKALDTEDDSRGTIFITDVNPNINYWPDVGQNRFVLNPSLGYKIHIMAHAIVIVAINTAKKETLQHPVPPLYTGIINTEGGLVSENPGGYGKWSSTITASGIVLSARTFVHDN